MRLTTFQICGWTDAKTGEITTLLQESDILCLTEVWSDPTNRPLPPGKRLYQALQPQTEGRYCNGGAVALLVPESATTRLLENITTAKFQLLSISRDGIPVVGEYLSPSATKEDRIHFLFHMTRLARRSSIILGDFNGRHKAWVSSTNSNGSALRQWAQQQRLTISIPPKPTFSSSRGSSVFDLILCRGLYPKHIVMGTTRCSNHKPIHMEVALSTAQSLDYIPLSTLNSAQGRYLASRSYRKHLPAIMAKLEQTSSPNELESHTMALGQATLQPWLQLRKPRPNRFRPGWTMELDKAARERSKLLKKGDPLSKSQAREIDRQIKAKVKENKDLLRSELGETLEGGNPKTR